MGFIPPTYEEWLNPELMLKKLIRQQNERTLFILVACVLCIAAAFIPFFVEFP
jgi:hypothetical protein